MITLTNRQTDYTVENNSENISLTGSVSFNDNGRILSFSGTFMTEQDSYIGTFYYNENESGRTSKSISDLDTTKFEEADELLDNTIKELKQQISEL